MSARKYGINIVGEMNPQFLPRRIFFYLAFHLYVKHRIQRVDRIRLSGLDFVVPPSVFHPRLYSSSKMMAEFLLGLDLASSQVLDLGSGSGILSLAAAKRGACVTSIDINPAAVTATIENARLNGLSDQVQVYGGDLFESIPVDSKFDLIVVNPPYYPTTPQNPGDYAWKAGEHYDVIARFAAEVRSHMKKGSRLLIVLSSDVDMPFISSLFDKAGLSLKRIRSRRLLFDTLSIYESYNQS